MIRSKELLGRQVVERATGRRLGRVAAVDYRPGEKYLRGLAVETAGLKVRRRYLRRTDIALLGQAAVLADGPLRVLPAQVGSPEAVYLPDGCLFGRIAALEIDPATARVHAAWVRVSLAEDLRQGCRRITAAELATREDRVLYHPPENEGTKGSERDDTVL